MNLKYLSLIGGVMQQTLLVLIIRYSKISNSDNYLTSVAVTMSEFLKIIFALTLEAKNNLQTQQNDNPSIESDGSKCNSSKKIFHLWGLMSKSLISKEGSLLIIPAILYLIQNNLIFLALSNLSVPVYQVTNQGKLLTTAILSRIFLGKKIRFMQYVAITILGLGVAIANLAETKNGGKQSLEYKNQKKTIGFCAMLICCLTSSMAGVYFEYLLKNKSTSNVSIHVRNFQLSFWSFVFGIVLIVYKDSDFIKKNGIFYGFNSIVLAAVVAQALVGLVVSLMLLYANAVLKGFAIAIAAIISSVLSMILFRTHLQSNFYLGAMMVLSSVRLYSYFEKNEKLPKKTLVVLVVSFLLSSFVYFQETQIIYLQG